MGISDVAMDTAKEFLAALLAELKAEGKNLSPSQKKAAGKMAFRYALAVAAKAAGRDMTQAMKYLKGSALDLAFIADTRGKKALARAVNKVFGTVGNGVLSMLLA